MENRNSKNELQLIMISVKLKPEFFYAQMLLKEDLIFQMFIGSYSMIHQMILKTIFIELDELQEVLKAKEKHFYFYLKVNLGSYDIFKNQRFL